LGCGRDWTYRAKTARQNVAAPDFGAGRAAPADPTARHDEGGEERLDRRNIGDVARAGSG